MERKIVHVIGTGTIGEPLIGLLCDYQDQLGIDEVTFHKNSALNIGGFNEDYKYIVDADFFKRFGSKYDIFAGKETVAKWRVHSNQATQKMEKIIFRESIETFKQYIFYEGVYFKTKLWMIFHILKIFLKWYLKKLNILSNNIND